MSDEKLTPAQHSDVNEVKSRLERLLTALEGTHGRVTRISKELERILVDLEVWQNRH